MEKKNGKKTGLTIAIVLIVFFAGFTGLNYFRAKQAKQEGVDTVLKVPVEISRSNVRQLDWTLELTGNIRPYLMVDVYPKVPGKIIENILVERGETVKQGDVIAMLENDTVRAQLEEASAALSSAKAALNQVEAKLVALEKDCIRLENLFNEKAISRQDLDHIDAEYKALQAQKNLAQANVQQAEAVEKRLKILFSEHTICAPESGYIGARYMDKGAMSSPTQAIVRISDESRLKIIGQISERDFPHVKEGMNADLFVDAYPDKKFSSTISIVSPNLDPATRTADIEIHIGNTEGILRSGMFARVNLYLGQKKAIAIPREALIRLPGTGNFYVFVVENDIAIQKNIAVGQKHGHLVEITSGIQEGDAVVVKRPKEKQE